MGYTKRKIRGINFSFLLAGVVFAGWALVCAWFGWPHGFRHGSTAALTLFSLAAIFFCAFPVIWARFPGKHPVNHDLMRYGNLGDVSARLDREMADHFEAIGPFRFTATMLVYDSGHEFQMIPYDQIVSAELEKAAPDDPHDDPSAVVIHTRKGRTYQWYRTWMQGIFDPEAVLEKIRSVIPANHEAPSITADPSTASQSPSTPNSPGSAQSLQ
jgi:hypothetical protein